MAFVLNWLRIGSLDDAEKCILEKVTLYDSHVFMKIVIRELLLPNLMPNRRLTPLFPSAARLPPL